MQAHAPSLDASPAAAGARECPSCGFPGQESFCPRCGEKRVEAGDYSLRGFLIRALEQLTSLDSRVLRSLRLLVTRPGLLTREYLAGRRRPYMGPLQVFLVCNVAFFLVSSALGVDALSSRLDTHLHLLPYSETARRVVEAEVAERGISLQQYRAEFDRLVGTQAKTLVILLAPAFALLLAPLQRRRYFVEHLVFALHFYAFYLLLFITVAGVLVAGGAALVAYGTPRSAAWQTIDLISVVYLLGCSAAYLFVALRRVYGVGRLAAGAMALALSLGTAVLLQLYRGLLFFTTYVAL